MPPTIRDWLLQSTTGLCVRSQGMPSTASHLASGTTTKATRSACASSRTSTDCARSLAVRVWLSPSVMVCTCSSGSVGIKWRCTYA